MLVIAFTTSLTDRPISGIVNKNSRSCKRQNIIRSRDGRFIKMSSSDHRQKRIGNVYRNSFISLQNNSSSPAADSALYLDHSYQSVQFSSTQPYYDGDFFDHVNETFF